MRIIVFSDSHGYGGYMDAVLREHLPDMVLHLGDHAADAAALARRFPGLKLRFVRGNCDGRLAGPAEICGDIGGLRFFCCHGHLFDVKRGTERAEKEASERGARVLLYGHTHIPELRCDGSLYVMNPGSAVSSAGLIDISDGIPQMKLIGGRP